ncbi:hypothetical protein O3G_MSEX008264 [Manduca sexta]|uniref:RING-type domain-containing protein n=1 Tax=Manduca sexta TaxID=7130 RepID=A0A922CQ32_MANSE|nr:hypothetical protein O3G_MSEX008264 [Manduca sexta]
MSEKTDTKPDALPDLDDLLQCPVCYEIPSGQIFQCNEGHHVCGRCKARLDVCPVCRALFFGTRNYAMEELIANVRKLRAFKLGGKVTTGTGSSECRTPAKETTSDESESNAADDEENDLQLSNRLTLRPPPACKGLFRCLCCKNGNAERLPAARLLNHLRYFHSSDLIEGQSENGEYLQAWQFSTVPGKLVTAVRVSDMDDAVCAWLTMAASPWVSHEFSYTVTISGNDREAIFSDCVWSVRSCEGSLKKRGHCLSVTGRDARALTAPVAISGKLSVRRTPVDQLTQQPQPRAVLRVANRGNANDTHTHNSAAHDLEPFLQDLQNDVARLSRAFATLGREANALVRSEAEMRVRIENTQNRQNTMPTQNSIAIAEINVQPTRDNPSPSTERTHLSRNARRRMRQRLRAALNASPSPPEQTPVSTLHQRNNQPVPVQRQNGPPTDDSVVHMTGLAIVEPSILTAPATQSTGGPSNHNPQNTNARTNKKKRRHRR